MASIRRISENSFKITVSCGRTAANKQIRHYMTWTPDKPMTEKQMETSPDTMAIMCRIIFPSADLIDRIYMRLISIFFNFS